MTSIILYLQCSTATVIAVYQHRSEFIYSPEQSLRKSFENIIFRSRYLEHDGPSIHRFPHFRRFQVDSGCRHSRPISEQCVV